MPHGPKADHEWGATTEQHALLCFLRVEVERTSDEPDKLKQKGSHDYMTSMFKLKKVTGRPLPRWATR